MQRVSLALAVVGAAAFVLVPGAAAQAPPLTLTLTEVSKGSTFHFIDNPPKSPVPAAKGAPQLSVGDAFVFRSRLRDQAGKAAGSVRAMCFVSRAGRADKTTADCFGVFSLAQGQLWASGSTTNSSTSTGVILGGTGIYANRHGTFVSKSTKAGMVDTITLIGG